MFNPLPHRRSRPVRASAAFTLMELLVVIGIMAVLAALIVGLAGVAGEKKVVGRVTAERDRLVTLIEAYKEKIGVYPPDNPDPRPEYSGTNTLYYELAGAIKQGNTYTLQLGPVVTEAELAAAPFNMPGIINSAGTDVEDKARIRWLLTEVKSDQTKVLANNIISLVSPQKVSGDNQYPWFYRSGTNAVHNPDRFDLWTVVKVRSGNKVIGNWKD